jgi:hypothetical protein
MYRRVGMSRRVAVAMVVGMLALMTVVVAVARAVGMNVVVGVRMLVGMLALILVAMAVARAIGMDVFMLVVGIITVDLHFSGAAAACGAHSCLRLPKLLRVP